MIVRTCRWAMIALAILAANLIAISFAQAQTPPWFSLSWGARHSVQIGNPTGTDLTSHQVLVTLDASFDFDSALTDGADLRVTDSNGVTLIPFWIESWNRATRTASVWVRLPTLPQAGTTIYFYYGNPTPPVPVASALPPTGPFAKHGSGPFVVNGAPYGSDLLYPENAVFDNGRIWVVLTDRGAVPNVISLVSSADGENWTYEGVVVVPSNPDTRTVDSPFIVQDNGNWYIFYSDSPAVCCVLPETGVTALARSTTGIRGPYTVINPALVSPTGVFGSWEATRVLEPHAVKLDNGDWVLLYMGDAGGDGVFENHEQIGLARSTTGVEGPYVKHPGNPVIRFGAPGSLDAGTIADPWIFRFQNTYYIGYAASPGYTQWNTSYATTTDWVTFTKSNQIILDQGPRGSWDDDSVWRGGVMQLGNTYYFPYSGYDGERVRFGLGTQPAVGVPPTVVNNPDAVFNFYDGFNGTTVDWSKWTIYKELAATGTATVSGGILTLRSGAGDDIVTMVGPEAFREGMVLEARARHPDADGSATTAAELGFGEIPRFNLLRIFDYDTAFFVKDASIAGTLLASPMTRAIDPTSFLLHRVYWNPLDVRYSLENDPPQVVLGPGPLVELSPWLLAYSGPKATRLEVDWIRVRRWAGAELTAALGTREVNATTPAPVIGSLTPSTATAGTAAFTLTVNGSNFVNTSVVRWNGNARTTTFVSSTKLTAAISATDIAAAGNATVTVLTPAPGGGTSSGLTFTVTPPVQASYPPPVLTSVSPTSATAGGAAFTLTVNGTDFQTNSKVMWNGSARTTTFVSATKLTAAITAADIATATTAQVTVFTTTPGGGTSVAQSFVITPGVSGCAVGQYYAQYFNNKTLTGTPVFTRCESSIQYDWGTSGPGNGVSVDGFSVRWRGFFPFNAATYTFTARADDGIRMYIDNVQLISGWLDQSATTYTANKTMTAGNHEVKVEYYDNTGSAVAQVSWGVPSPAPTLSSLSPATTVAGSGGLTLTVNGSNFVPSSVVRWNGSSRTTTYVSATQLTAAIAASDVASTGSQSVTVFTPSPGGGTSSAATFVTTACQIGQFYAQYYNNTSLSYSPVYTACQGSVGYDWGTGGPGHNVNSDNFSARWSGRFDFAAGTYTFRARASDGVKVWVDGTLIISQWVAQSATTFTASKTLSAGQHDVKVEYYEGGGSAVAEVTWSAPYAGSCGATQFMAQYYNNTSLSGTPVMTRCEGPIAYDWGTSSPGTGVNSDGFSVRWTARLPFSAGTYTFFARADDGVRMWLDGTQIINGWVDQSATRYTSTKTVTAAKHDLKIEYYDRSSSAGIQVGW